MTRRRVLITGLGVLAPNGNDPATYWDALVNGRSGIGTISRFDASWLGFTADAYHITDMAPGGEGGVRAMKIALRDAGMQPERLDYVNAHGTSTVSGDSAETAVLRTVFGEHARTLAVSSTKSMTGHLLGVASAIESVACVLALHHGVLPPTINYETPDPACDLDFVPNQARETHIEVALSNSFGFGGHNVALLFGRAA